MNDMTGVTALESQIAKERAETARLKAAFDNQARTIRADTLLIAKLQSELDELRAKEHRATVEAA